jgi:hypothetical protein
MPSPKSCIPGLARTRERFIKEAMDGGATYREAKKRVDPGLAQYERAVRTGNEPPPKKWD